MVNHQHYGIIYLIECNHWAVVSTPKQDLWLQGCQISLPLWSVENL